ncbi:hypothetical protein Zmor_004433 [Zophobas morio]|uniref:Peptidase M20 dimerisation domain-containing protein n=1 Tax=Zophobas morio TaxID=2755281 RepID=A0AA38LZF8_9CUCU|nr:hypothetical protein Zmor_004433 [Zophobas morio]
MTDLIHLFSKLITSDGKLLIPGISNTVAPLTEKELELYKKVDFSIEDFKRVGKCIQENPVDFHMARWRYPSLSIHGIQGAFSGEGSKTVIPCKVTGKFSIRLVPNQEPEKIQALVSDFLKTEFAGLQSPNKLHIYSPEGGMPWVSDPDHPNYMAGKRAIQQVYGVEPDFTREGGSIPVALTFEKATGRNVLLLPLGRGDDGAHSVNEKIDESNYINGIKLLGAYLQEVSKL